MEQGCFNNTLIHILQALKRYNSKFEFKLQIFGIKKRKFNLEF